MGIRDEILGNAKAMPSVGFYAYGKPMYCQKLSLRQSAKLMDFLKGIDELSDEAKVLRIAQIVVAFTLDEKGDRIFSDEDAAILADHQDADSLTTAFERIIETNAVTKAKIDEAKKD